MSWIRRLRSLFEKQKLEDQLDEELQFHIDARTQEFIATGMAPEEVRMTAPKAEGPEEDAVSSVAPSTEDSHLNVPRAPVLSCRLRQESCGVPAPFDPRFNEAKVMHLNHGFLAV